MQQFLTPEQTKELQKLLELQKKDPELTSTKFEPTDIIVITIMNGNLYFTRKQQEFKKFSNLYTLEYDRQQAEAGVSSLLGASDIRRYENVSCKEFVKIFKELADELHANKKLGKKTLVYFQYGGHGVQDVLTDAICNSEAEAEDLLIAEKKTKVRFSIEA